MSESNQQEPHPAVALSADLARNAVASAGAVVAVASLTAVTLTAAGAHLGLNLVRAAMPRIGRAALPRRGRPRLR